MFTGLSRIFLSKSSRNKKFDDKKSSFSFDFAEIQEAFSDAIKEKSFEPIMESDSSPILLVYAILTIIGFLYVIIAVFSSVLLSVSSPGSVVDDPAMQALSIEISEVLTKLVDIRKSGNMKEYEAFLQPTMTKYCLNHLDTNFFDATSLESFHMNLAQTVSFIAAGNKFSNHKSLIITSKGGIIDPQNSEEPTYLIDTAKSCPLLDQLFLFGKADNQCTARSCSVNDNNDTSDTDIPLVDRQDTFDKQYSWKNMEEFFELILRCLTAAGDCSRIPKELNKDSIKSFILNFYEMADIIGRESIKEEKEGKIKIEQYHNDPNSGHWKKYVVGMDGAIYETDDYSNDKEYIHCNQIENVLNDKFELDENLSYTNIKIAIDEKFDEWYNKIQQNF